MNIRANHSDKVEHRGNENEEQPSKGGMKEIRDERPIAVTQRILMDRINQSDKSSFQFQDIRQSNENQVSQQKSNLKLDVLKTGLEGYSEISQDRLIDQISKPRAEHTSGAPIQRTIVYKPKKSITKHDYEALLTAIHAEHDISILRKMHEAEKEYTVDEVIKEFDIAEQEVDWGQEPPDEKEEKKVKVQEPKPSSDEEDGFQNKNHELTETEKVKWRNYRDIHLSGFSLSPSQQLLKAIINEVIRGGKLVPISLWRNLQRTAQKVEKAKNSSKSGTGSGEEKNAVPKGYQAISAFGSTVYVKGLDILSSAHANIAQQHLVMGNIHKSSKMKGAAAGSPYLHTSKSDSSSLYLLQDDGKAPDGTQMWTILKSGSVSDGIHKF